jgi:hypothetical protein
LWPDFTDKLRLSDERCIESGTLITQHTCAFFVSVIIHCDGQNKQMKRVAEVK